MKDAGLNIIDIAVFAHNEEDNIADILLELDQQDILESSDHSVNVYILANGCQDKTVTKAEGFLSQLNNSSAFSVHDLSLGGKSRTWNTFTHHISRADVGILVFMDADISMPDGTTLRRLVKMLAENAQLDAVTSKPVKDIVINPVGLSPIDKVIAKAGGTLNDWRHSICGQLYAMRADTARSFHLPIGLPVEDGFVRAMITTSVLSETPTDRKIDGSDDVYHVYKSERSIAGLLRHQTRIVIGSAINATLFEVLRREDGSGIKSLLKVSSENPEWLPGILRNELPKAKSGWVPWHFLFKRINNFRHQASFKSKVIIILGFGFDAVAFVMAQIRMARGAGAGFW